MITIPVLAHSGAHSFVQVIRHQLGHAGKDLCDGIQAILKVRLYVCGDVLQAWNFHGHRFLFRSRTLEAEICTEPHIWL